jgi:hypothetical protein
VSFWGDGPIPDGVSFYVPDVWAKERELAWVKLPPVILPADKPAVLSFFVGMISTGYLCGEVSARVRVNDVVVYDTTYDGLQGYAWVPVTVDLSWWGGQAVRVQFEHDMVDCIQALEGSTFFSYIRIIAPDPCP